MRRVVFCWAGTSGYMAACWRALHASGRADLHVLYFDETVATAFGDEIMAGIPSTKLDAKLRNDPDAVGRIVEGLDPDVVVLAGWLSKSYMALPHRPALRAVKFVMGMDTPWRGGARQRAARFALRRYLGRLDAVVVPGERAWQYATRLGVSEGRIHKGLYGVDHRGFSAIHAARTAAVWPKSFLFIGRYAPEKGLARLVEAYRLYRLRVSDPWPLDCCGKGPLAAQLRTTPGCTDHGFLQPEEVRERMLMAGAFVLPSEYDPWPLALVEACAAGLPVIASTACGSGVECLRSDVNGWTFPADDVEALSECLVGAHRAYSELPAMGLQSLWMAKPYGAENWLRVWSRILDLGDGAHSD